jgi:hypothetical protein
MRASTLTQPPPAAAGQVRGQVGAAPQSVASQQTTCRAGAIDQQYHAALGRFPLSAFRITPVIDMFAQANKILAS